MPSKSKFNLSTCANLYWNLKTLAHSRWTQFRNDAIRPLSICNAINGLTHSAIAHPTTTTGTSLIFAGESKTDCLCVHCAVEKRLLTCSCVSILLEPVICEFNLRKCAIKRLISFRFIPSSNDDGTKRSNPNSRLWGHNENREEEQIVKLLGSLLDSWVRRVCVCVRCQRGNLRLIQNAFLFVIRLKTM